MTGFCPGMRTPQQFTLGVLLLAGLFTLVCRPATAAQPGAVDTTSEPRVQAALERVRSSLPRTTAGDDWRSFLKLAELEQQVALGKSADPESVASILARFRQDHEFLRGEPYVTMRDAIIEWLPALDAANPERAAELAATQLAAFEPASPAELQTALAEMRASAAEMETFLKAHPDVRAGWEDYFAWPKWQAELNSPDVPNPDVLASVSARLESAVSMFPDPVCQRAASTMRSNTRVVYRAATTREEAAEWLQKVVRLTQIPAGELTSPYAEELRAANVWLQRRDIGGRLCAAALNLHSRPNFRLAVSRKLLALGIDSQINTTDPFVDVIQGVTYRGTANTQGNVELALLPNPRQIALQLSCKLNISSRSVGSASGATIEGGSTTSVSGSKVVAIDPTGIALRPAQADANTSSQIYGVNTGRRFGQQRANEGAEQGRAATEQEIARMAEQRLEDELNREASRYLAPVIRSLQNSIRRSLILVDGMPQQMRTWSTPDFAYLVLTQAGLKQLGANQPAPSVREPSDLMVQMHESFVQNMGDSLLAGKSLTELEIQSLLESWFGAAPASMQTSDPENLWRITFEKQRPLELQISNNHLKITLRASAFQIGDKPYPAVQIHANYKLDPNEPGLVATLADRLELDDPSLQPGEKLGGRQQAFHTMLRKRFAPVFPNNWEARTIVVTTPANQHPEVLVRKVVADNGWITLAGEMLDSPMVSQRPRSNTAQ